MAIAGKNADSTFNIKITADSGEFEKALKRLQESPIMIAATTSGNPIFSAGAATVVIGSLLTAYLQDKIVSLVDAGFRK